MQPVLKMGPICRIGGGRAGRRRCIFFKQHFLAGLFPSTTSIRKPETGLLCETRSLWAFAGVSLNAEPRAPPGGRWGAARRCHGRHRGRPGRLRLLQRRCPLVCWIHPKHTHMPGYIQNIMDISLYMKRTFYFVASWCHTSERYGDLSPVWSQTSGSEQLPLH